MSAALDAVVELLDLEQIELNIFRGRSPEGERRQRVFGGQVAGQALVAAGRTVPADRPVNSLHSFWHATTDFWAQITDVRASALFIAIGFTLANLILRASAWRISSGSCWSCLPC